LVNERRHEMHGKKRDGKSTRTTLRPWLVDVVVDTLR
jgi:hypothetical protein